MINRDQFPRVVELFEAACDLEPKARLVFLDSECGDDLGLRREVEALLEQDDRIEDTSLLARVGQEISQEAADVTGSGAAPPSQLGPFRILDRLGVGGMGVVYRAEQENPRRTVALKVVSSGALSPSAVRRLEFESEVLGRLQHPGIAQVYHAGFADTGSGERIPYFAMELIEGSPLESAADDAGLNVRERLELFARVCDAVHHAHQKGIIHRDLKPANILVVAGSPRPGTPKVLDFGVARAVATEDGATGVRTASGQLVGTLPYMSPEQVSGDPEAIDVRSDVYSLGVILYELLSGTLPIDPGTALFPEAARRIVDEVPVRLGRLNPQCRGDVETIVAKALEKEPDRRYVSAAELAADIRRTLRNEPIAARPASRIYLIGKFARRNRSFVIGTVLVVLALGLGVLAERQQRIRAESAIQDLEIALEGSEKVTRVLTRLFSAADPIVSAGRTVTIREKLLGMESEFAEFADQPQIESRLRNVIGEACFGLGEYRLARAHLERSLELRRELYGDDHPSTCRTMSALAPVLLAFNETRQALEFAEAAYRGFRKTVGIGHDETLTALSLIANAQERLRSPEAEAHYRQTLELCVEHLGEENKRTLQVQSNLGLMLKRAGKAEEAELLLRDVFETRLRILGERHPRTGVARNNLGHFLNGAGRYDEALVYLEAAHRIASETLGDDHTQTLRYGNNLGVTLYALKRYTEARPFFESAVRKHRAELGPDNPTTLLSSSNLAGLLRKIGDHQAALDQFPDIVEGTRKAYPPGHPSVAITERLYGLTLLDVKRHEEAEPLLLGAYRTHLKALGSGHIRTRQARESIVQLYDSWGRPDEADQWRASPDKSKPKRDVGSQ